MPPPSRQVAGGAPLAPANAMSWRLWPGDEHLRGFVCFFFNSSGHMLPGSHANRQNCK